MGAARVKLVKDKWEQIRANSSHRTLQFKILQRLTKIRGYLADLLRMQSD